MKKLILVLILPFGLAAEETELWKAAKISKPLNDSYILSVESDFRSTNMGDQLKYCHGDIGVSFPINSKIKMSINLREVFEWNGETWKQEHRPHGTLSTNMKLGSMSISARSRFEYRIKQDNDPVIRNRDMVSINFGKGLTPLNLVPYFANEIFYDMEERKLNRNRLYIGVEIKRIQFVKTAIYFLQQNDIKNNEWKPTNVVGIKFLF